LADTAICLSAMLSTLVRRRNTLNRCPPKACVKLFLVLKEARTRKGIKYLSGG